MQNDAYVKETLDWQQNAMHPLLKTIITSYEFQRLKHVKQLGLTDRYYFKATHTRFDHSVGTSYLATKLMTHLRMTQPELDITEKEELCVSIAALCHDLGHGPFSHLFESLPFLSDWKHEKSTIAIFDVMCCKYPVSQSFKEYGLGDDEIILIKDLIYVPAVKEQKNKEKAVLGHAFLTSSIAYLKKNPSKSFLFEIVSNIHNGIDVDKFDYLKRDCSAMDIVSYFDYDAYIKNCRVIEVNSVNRICVNISQLWNILQLFATREKCISDVFKSSHVYLIHLMMLDVLKMSNHFFKFERILQNYNCVVEFDDDTVLTEVADNPLLKSSRDLLDRISNKKCYTPILRLEVRFDFIGSVRALKKGKFQTDLDTHLKSRGLEVFEIDFEILTINQGCGSDWPINNVFFFEDSDLEKAFNIPFSSPHQLLESDNPMCLQTQTGRIRKLVKLDIAKEVEKYGVAFPTEVEKQYMLFYTRKSFCDKDEELFCTYHLRSEILDFLLHYLNAKQDDVKHDIIYI